MKSFLISITAVFVLAVVLWGCSAKSNNVEGTNPEDIEGKKEAIEKYEAQIDEIEDKISELEKEIVELGGTVEPVHDTIPITTYKLERKDFSEFLEFSGVVGSKKNLNISSEMPGVVEQINVVEGQSVGANQVLVELDATVIENNIAELQTSIDLAQTVYDKRKKLWDQNIGSEVDYLQAENNLKSLQNKLATAQSELAKASIKSPISGTVDEIFINSGEITGAGQPLMRVVNLSTVQVKADISEVYVADVKRGDMVKISFPSLDYEVDARISSVGQVIDPNNRTFSIEVNLPNRNNMLKPNLLARISIERDKQADQVVVPTYLIRDDGRGSQFVFMVEDSKVEKVKINTGKTSNGETIVTDGLDGTEILVDKGFQNVFDGALVKDLSN